MCQAARQKESFLPEKKYRLADYFNQYWDEYVKSPKQYITPEQFKAVNAIRVCRTPALGVDVYSCKDCGEVTEVFHSCKNRFCPTCSWEDTVRWADNLKSRMMAIPHRHVVMTLPHELEPLIKSNDKQLLNVLLRVTADTFRDWMGHKYGINPGIISVLHTFGETKSYHPHVHMIVSWGGIHRATGRLKPIKGHFVNYKFLQKKFRCKFEDELVLLFDKERLKQKFPDRTAFLHFIQRINKTDWVLHLEPPMDIPAQVVRYIGRYSKRACLSEYKITKIEGEYIRFRYKDYRSLDENRKPVEKELELHYRDFFPRLLQHVPLRYFRLVRYYGAYSNKSRIPEEYLHHEVEEQEVNEPPAKGKNEGENRLICPSCKKIKRYQYTLFRHRTTGYEKRYRRKLTRHFMGIGRKAA